MNELDSEKDIFALNFLMPKSEIVMDLQKKFDFGNPEVYISLKEKYHVSIFMIELRAYNLRLMTDKQHLNFRSQFESRNYQLGEPLDRVISFKRSGKIRRIFNLVLDNDLTDIHEIENHYNMKLALIEHFFY